MSKTLGTHQLYALECMKANNSLGIFYSPGCGKTIIVLTWLVNAYKEGLIKDALVICPASLVDNWVKDISEATDFDHMTEDDVKILQNIVTIRSFQKTYMSKVNTIHHRDGFNEDRRTYSLREDIDHFWSAIIVDEAHGIGNHKSRQCKTAETLSKMTKYRYILTGTPFSGSTSTGGRDMSKLYGELKFLRPSIWRNWTDFSNRFVSSWGRFYNPTGYKEAELDKIVSDMAIACRLEDCYDLPEAVEQLIPCKLSEKKVYNDVKKGVQDKYNLDINNPGGEFNKLLQLCSGFMHTEKGIVPYKTSKFDVLADILSGTDEKIVIFARFTASIDNIFEICKKNGKNPTIFDGRSNGPTWKDFVGGKYDVLITQYQAGGAGLNLQCASTMIFFEPCFSTLLLEQAKGRIMRPGQHNNCRYLYLYTPGTAEEHVVDSVREGLDITEEKIRNWVMTGNL